MSALDDLKADLAKLRDEAKVQVHLGTMETKQEWEEIEAKWNRFVAEAGLHKSGEGIKAALQSLGNELRAAYQRLKQRSEEHTSELQSLMRISYAVFCLKKKTKRTEVV